MSDESWASSSAVRRTMQANTRRDTGPELRLRSELHRMGLRYLVDVRPLPDLNRRADLVFRRARVAVFVHGCFWHGCSRHYVPPKSNREFWRTKVEGNARRDRQTERALRRAGWSVVTIWEHEDPPSAARRVARVVRARLGRGGPR